ncbi:hypothetical protein Nepgr_026920 [Nepenthes gracilis]|uniref:Uncharacterized protein n=1 Tax=Nepenthes gracilis TaxID=150966 RepID=A0AAD3Y0U0_NEPGR|nr:hypothetical protein Nepgr_026920 [Nepenthes gracilis]
MSPSRSYSSMVSGGRHRALLPSSRIRKQDRLSSPELYRRLLIETLENYGTSQVFAPKMTGRVDGLTKVKSMLQVSDIVAVEEDKETEQAVFAGVIPTAPH